MSDKCKYCGGSHKDQEHYLTRKPYSSTSGMNRGNGGTHNYKTGEAKSKALNKKKGGIGKKWAEDEAERRIQD